MKRRNLWILLAALAVVGIVVLALLGHLGGKEETKTPEGEAEVESTATPEPTPVDPELPLDETPLTPVEEDAEEESGESGGENVTPTQGGESPTQTPQPEDGGLDADELPIFP